MLNRAEARFLINSGVSAALYIALLFFAGRDAVSNFGIYVFATLVNYLGSKYYVFQSQARPASSIVKFSALVAVSIGANTVLVWVGVNALGLSYVAAGVVFLMLWAVFSFLAQKYWVFGE